ncbi:hypothetical protein G4O51_00360 [Candidatus Bathyarchaeota archaeon A05DMB-2]|nr:hypothetical protein [Candidatus Bathyarchaeota archaeon A05DMB-2]
MKKKPITAGLIAICLAITYLQTTNSAKAYPILEMPPKVNVPEMNVNATIYKVNGTLWAKIDAEYTMHAVYAYGDSYLAENYGMGLVLHPDSPYVMVTVTQDVLEAHYPVPPDARNISVSLNGEEVEVHQDAHGFFHIFDADLAEINWTVSPVPDDFVVAVHYEQPIPEITETYAHLGNYAVTLPLYGRYGCSNISYPLYSWYGHPPNNYRIQIESRTALAQMQVYSVDAQGTLTTLNPNLTAYNVLWVITFCRGTESSFVHGAVLVFSVLSEEGIPFPFLPFVAATTVISVAVMAGLLIYFKKHHVKTLRHEI